MYNLENQRNILLICCHTILPPNCVNTPQTGLIKSHSKIIFIYLPSWSLKACALTEWENILLYITDPRRKFFFSIFLYSPISKSSTVCLESCFLLLLLYVTSLPYCDSVDPDSPHPSSIVCYIYIYILHVHINLINHSMIFLIWRSSLLFTACFKTIILHLYFIRFDSWKQF